MKKGKGLIPVLSVAAVAAVFGVSMYANAAVPGFSIQSFGRFEYDMNHDGTNEIVLDSTDLRNLKSAIENLDASTTQDITALKNQVDNDLAAKLEEMNTTFSTGLENMNNTFSNGIADEKKARKKADDAIYRILGMSNVDQETDDSGNIVERDDDGNVTRVIRTETTVNGTVITVTRYDISKTPEEFLDKVSFDTQTKKATTKEGSIVDPIIKVNEPEEGQVTVIITNNDGTKSTIVYAEDTDLDDIEQYLRANGFTDEQIAIVRQLIADAVNSGATTKQEIINYITNHTITPEELQNLLKGLNAPSTDNEIGVTMDEVKAYLKTLTPALSDEEITNVINKYLTIDGLTPEEIQIIINAINDGSADTDHSGLVTKAELEAYLGSASTINTMTVTNKLPVKKGDVSIMTIAEAFSALDGSNSANESSMHYDPGYPTDYSNGTTYYVYGIQDADTYLGSSLSYVDETITGSTAVNLQAVGLEWYKQLNKPASRNNTWTVNGHKVFGGPLMFIESGDGAFTGNIVWWHTGNQGDGSVDQNYWKGKVWPTNMHIAVVRAVEGQPVPSYTPEEIAKLAAAYINIPSTTEINNYYKSFTPTEVNHITTAITEKYDDTVLKTSIKNVSDAQVSILDKIDDLKTYVDHGGNDMSYDGVRVKYTPKTDTSPAMAIFSPINPNSN